MMIKEKELRYEIERVRVYVAHTIVNELKAGSLTQDKAKKMAREVLDATKKVADIKEIDKVLDELVKKHPLLEPARVRFLSYEEEQEREIAANKVTQLLKQGKIEEAGMLARKYTQKES